MIEADRVHSTPPLNSSAFPEGLARQQAERIQAIARLANLRREARAEINRLIDLLDRSDPYVMTELEDDDSCLVEEGGDLEPSLGSFDRMIDQERSYRPVVGEYIGSVDLEHDTSDFEPSLGSLDHDHHPNQENWAMGDRRDLELDGAESGIGDIDGLLEQVGPRDWQAGKGRTV